MKLKYVWVPFLLAMVGVVPFGINLLLNLSRDELSIPLLCVVTFFIFIIIIMSGFSKNVQSDIKIQKNIPAFVFSLIAGMLLILDSVNQFLNNFGQSGDSKFFFLGIFEFLAAITFIFMAVSSFVGKNIFEKAPILSLFPTIWCCMRLAVVFIRYTSVAKIDTNIYDMFSIIFMLVVLFVIARVFVPLNGKNMIKRSFMSGMPAIILIFLYSVSELIYNINTSGRFILSNNLPYFVDLFIALYIVSILTEFSFPSKFNGRLDGSNKNGDLNDDEKNDKSQDSMKRINDLVDKLFSEAEVKETQNKKDE